MNITIGDKWWNPHLYTWRDITVTTSRRKDGPDPFVLLMIEL